MFRGLKLKCTQLVLLAMSFLMLLPATTSLAATAPNLGTAASFAVLGGQTVTNTGPSIIVGDLGLHPGSAVTGFPPGTVLGAVHVADAVALQAQSDLTVAYNNAAGQPCDFNLTDQDLGGMTLVPGVYCFSTSAQLTGTLTLDAQGDPNAVFIFQVGSTLTTASASRVMVINGGSGSNCNVFWQIGSSATLGTTTSFIGTIMALTSISVQTGANIDGRALARNGSVTLDTNVITRSTCAVPPVTPIAPTVGKAFSPATINAGGTSTLTITLGNVNSTPATLTAPLIDTLPTGVVVAGTPNAANTCGGAVTAVAGSSTVTLTGGAIPANGTCTVTVDVTAADGGTYVNALAVGALETTNGSNVAPAVATVTVLTPGADTPPVISKAFSPATINAGGTSTLTITLNNTQSDAATLTAPFTDTLPSGVVVAATPNAANTCGGTVTAVAGSSTVTLTGGAIPANGSCTVTVSVTAPGGGNFINTIPAGALQTSNGNNAAPAIATLTVLPKIVSEYDCRFSKRQKGGGRLSCTASGIVCIDQANTNLCAQNTLRVRCGNGFRLEDLSAESEFESGTFTISGSQSSKSAVVEVSDFLGAPGTYQSSLDVNDDENFETQLFGSCSFK